MTRRPESAGRRTPGGGDTSPRAGRRALVFVVVAAVVAAGLWMLFRPSRTARIVEETIAMQDEVLSDAGDPAATRARIDTIMRNIDQLQPAEIRRVREALMGRLRTLGEQSVVRFVDASPEDRTALLDGDIARLQVARGIFEATEQGGMRPFTEAEIREREERRRMTAEERREADRARQPPDQPAARAASVTAAVDRKLVERYFEALGQRAKEKKVELGRMFLRPPGRG